MKILILFVATVIIACDAFSPNRKNCPTNCIALFDPVCGSDGETYSNSCYLEVQKCLTDDSTLTEVPCREKRRAEYCPDICTMQYDPVCGSNGVVYNNQCEFWKAKCRNPSLILKGRGECDRIDFYCDGPCFGLYEPQCGSDGRMYTNKCTFMKQQICHNPDLTLGTNC